MLRVGLTGGIGSGKSEVARLLAARGALVVDSDALAREVVAPGTAGLAAVVEAFGPDYLDAHGALDRPRLARLVFQDPQARERLNAVVHPLVGAAAAERLAQAPEDAIVVHDVPLLVETGMTPLFDVVVVVDTDRETQLERLVAQRGMTRQDAEARIDAQATREERLAAADHVIRNDGSLRELEEQVARLWQILTNDPDERATLA
ncbi:MAG TPA: dephospho-CoA kinase [Frankiaceae bacterium]|nr:dephospho-CoA kinase [Frankiaceae bacterium]